MSVPENHWAARLVASLPKDFSDGGYPIACSSSRPAGGSSSSHFNGWALPIARFRARMASCGHCSCRVGAIARLHRVGQGGHSQRRSYPSSPPAGYAPGRRRNRWASTDRKGRGWPWSRPRSQLSGHRCNRPSRAGRAYPRRCSVLRARLLSRPDGACGVRDERCQRLGATLLLRLLACSASAFPDRSAANSFLRCRVPS